MTASPEKRIQLIDALRGIDVVLMVIHHFFYDLVVFLGAPAWLFSNPVFDFLHYVFAGLFIVLSGVSSRFSRSNVKRGIKVLSAALAITLVTYFMEMPIRFGVLHLLGFCMVFYGVTHKLWDGAPRVFALGVTAAMTAATALLTYFVPLDTKYLWMFGWTYPGFYSADYFPIFPWLFVFLFGTVLGAYIKEGRFPKRFYEVSPPFFPAVGRHALIIYLLHQPVLYGITMLLALLKS